MLTPIFLEIVHKQNQGKFFDSEALEDYLKYFRNHETVRCICDDYRAALHVDYFHDEKDKYKNKIKCPLLVLWGKKAKIEQWYDPIKVWKDWEMSLEIPLIVVTILQKKNLMELVSNY